MSYLADFVKSLTDTELQVFKKLDVIGKEEEVRDAYVRNFGKKTIDDKWICKQLQITQTHFDKINSVLLYKVMYALYGNDYNSMLSGVLQKGLTALFFHELKIVERGLLMAKNKQILQTFYRAAFDNLRSMFHPTYNSKLTRSFGKKYLLSLGRKKTQADDCYVAMMVLYGDILQAAFAGTDQQFSGLALKRIQESRRQYYRKLNHTVDFYIDFTSAAYYKHLTEDANAFVNALENAQIHCKNAEQEVRKKYEGIVLCELGFGLIYLNRFIDAKHRYAEAFKQFPDTLAKTFYHAGNYFSAALCARDYSSAQRIFDCYLRPRIQPATNRSVLFDIYFMGVWLHLHIKEYNKATEFLNLLQQYKRTEITVMGQAMLRQVECAYFYIKADTATAYTIVERNLRQLKKLYAKSNTVAYYYQYVDTVHQLLRLQQGKLRYPEKLRIQLQALPTGINQVYNIPLQDAAAELLAQ